MPLDELNNSEPVRDGAGAAIWPEIDRRLLGVERPEPAAFPLHLLPERWRAWVESTAQGFTPVDYLAQSLLAAVSAVCGKIVVAVTPQWSEPLVLWQALVGGPSTGKTPALMAARRLLKAVPARNEAGDRMVAVPHAYETADMLARDAKITPGGAVLWCDDLMAWLAGLLTDQDRMTVLSGWSADVAHASQKPGWWPIDVERFALGIVGALQDDQLAAAFHAVGDGGAARFLYVWPVPRAQPALGRKPANHDAVAGMLRALAALPATVETPYALTFHEPAIARLEAILPSLRAAMLQADGLEAAWIGKAAGNIVRLAGLLSLMGDAQEGRRSPKGVAERHVTAAHELWSGYFWPHAQAVFGLSGTTEADRLARRATRWLRRTQATEISRQDIRRYALGKTVNAEETDEVIAQLESAGLLRFIDDARPSGGRPRRRWEVNPALA